MSKGTNVISHSDIHKEPFFLFFIRTSQARRYSLSLSPRRKKLQLSSLKLLLFQVLLFDASPLITRTSSLRVVTYQDLIRVLPFEWLWGFLSNSKFVSFFYRSPFFFLILKSLQGPSFFFLALLKRKKLNR